MAKWVFDGWSWSLFLELGIVTVLVIMYIVKNLSDIGSYSNYKDMVQMENDCLPFCEKQNRSNSSCSLQPHTKQNCVLQHTFSLNLMTMLPGWTPTKDKCRLKFFSVCSIIDIEAIDNFF